MFLSGHHQLGLVAPLALIAWLSGVSSLSIRYPYTPPQCCPSGQLTHDVTGRQVCASDIGGSCGGLRFISCKRELMCLVEKGGEDLENPFGLNLALRPYGRCVARTDRVKCVPSGEEGVRCYHDLGFGAGGDLSAVSRSQVEGPSGGAEFTLIPHMDQNTKVVPTCPNGNYRSDSGCECQDPWWTYPRDHCCNDESIRQANRPGICQIIKPICSEVVSYRYSLCCLRVFSDNPDNPDNIQGSLVEETTEMIEKVASVGPNDEEPSNTDQGSENGEGNLAKIIDGTARGLLAWSKESEEDYNYGR